MLTDTGVKNAKPKPKAKQCKINDGGGLLLVVHPSGGKWWRLRYRFEGREKMLSLGTYPAVSLAKAREKRDTARKQLADGIDPSAARKAKKKA
ncbi:MAG: Arm DNA-binding domain-containing protein, partial [Desulfosarcina sp.]